jgi:murein DD-endopeptidase MepM/ murein hydrolase activator NlpD
MVRVEVRTMISISGLRQRVMFGLKSAQSAAIAATIVVAGCSADVTRFDSTSFNFNDPPQNGGETGTVAPVPHEPVYGNGLNHSSVAHATPRGPYNAGAGSVDVAALPEADGAAPQEPVPSYQAQPFRDSDTTPVEVPPSNHTSAKGDVIEVRPGDTLYGLSKRHQVSVSELMSVNGLSGTNLKPGQKLHLPDGTKATANLREPATSKRFEAVAASPQPVDPDVAAKYAGTYVVQPGDSICNIARAHQAPYGELQRVNGIADPRKVRPGTVLKVPGAPVAAAETISQQTPEAVATAQPQKLTQTTTQPTVINSGKQVAALSDNATDAAPAAAKQEHVATAEAPVPAPTADSIKLRWPASGKIIAGFGGRPDGTHNDGINLSVPLGTDVHAAESGVVAYAGSELKGYGNLILVRHDNGWVTAYAHNDELLVKRGDKVRRGQVISKAGKTGTVDQPQVHFELRQGSKPVDPTPYLEKI